MKYCKTVNTRNSRTSETKNELYCICKPTRTLSTEHVHLKKVINRRTIESSSIENSKTIPGVEQMK